MGSGRVSEVLRRARRQILLSETGGVHGQWTHESVHPGSRRRSLALAAPDGAHQGVPGTLHCSTIHPWGVWADRYQEHHARLSVLPPRVSDITSSSSSEILLMALARIGSKRNLLLLPGVQRAAVVQHGREVLSPGGLLLPSREASALAQSTRDRIRPGSRTLTARGSRIESTDRRCCLTR
ncbi:uncharacterized protein [Heptranchias perlo]|uniref:uncharacterized protein isoform X4 n=1 Tax=Heptranchias perlo TaxID=212740 RepID=UPI00355A6DE3